jgi:maleylacetoacetate isomerase
MRLLADPRSSASLRVLCYLDHKGREIEFAPLSLRAGDHADEAFTALNPSRAVPALDLGERGVIAQSLAIVEYLESLWPEPPLLPADPVQRARVRNLCGLVAADIHPLTNMRVRKEVTRLAGAPAEAEWNRHWTVVGLDALEAWVARDGGQCAVADTLTLADFFVVPLLFNAGRLGVELQPWPRLQALYSRSLALPAFARLR